MAKNKSKKIVPKPKGRDTKVCSCTGTTGTGKSYKANEIAKKLASKSNNKVLVISYAGSGDSWNHCKEIEPTEKDLKFKTGWKKIIYLKHYSRKDKKFPLLEIFNHFRNGIIIFDDCKMYMKGDWENTPGLKLICNEHRHFGYDMFFIAHSPKHIPKQVWAYIAHAWVFKCAMKLEESDLDNENALKFVEAQKKVNSLYAEEYERIKRKPRGLCKYITL